MGRLAEEEEEGSKCTFLMALLDITAELKASKRFASSGSNVSLSALYRSASDPYKEYSPPIGV